MIKIYPSSYAFPQGATTNPKYNSGCLRYQKFKDKLLTKSDIGELSKAIGVIGEERVKLYLQKQYPGQEIKQEISFKFELEDGVWISGRYDFKIEDSRIAVEVKTTKSTNVRSDIINKGLYSKDHLGQLLTYMCVEEVTKGLLCVQYVHFTKDLENLHFIPRWFDIELKDNYVFVDNESTGYTVDYFMQFYSLVADTHKSDKLPPKPANSNACFFCPFKSICTGEEPPCTVEEFNKQLKTLKAENKPRKDDIPCHDIKSSKNT